MKYVYQAFNRPLSTINNALGWYNTDEIISTNSSQAKHTEISTKVDDLVENDLQSPALTLADQDKPSVSEPIPAVKPVHIKQTHTIALKKSAEGYSELEKLAAIPDIDMAAPEVTNSYWYKELQRLTNDAEELELQLQLITVHPQIYKFVCQMIAKIGNVAKLNFDYATMQDHAVDVFQILTTTPGLQSISLERTSITKQDNFVQIAKMFAESSLIELDLSHNTAPINSKVTCDRFLTIVNSILDEVTFHALQHKTIHIRDNGNYAQKKEAYQSLTQRVEEYNSHQSLLTIEQFQDSFNQHTLLPDLVDVIGDYYFVNGVTLDLI